MSQQSTFVNIDRHMAESYEAAFKEGELRITCDDEKEPYVMRFQFYNFLKRLRAGNSPLSPLQIRRVLELQPSVMIQLEGRDFIMRSRAFVSPGMAKLAARLQGAVAKKDDKVEESVMAMGDRLLAALNQAPGAVVVPPATELLPDADANPYQDLLRGS